MVWNPFRRQSIAEAEQPGQELQSLREVVQQYESSYGLVQERMAELELALEDDGWMRISGESNKEFSREGLRRIGALSRLAFAKNPLINRGVNIQALYVWGQGVNIEARHPDVDAVVQDFLDDYGNQAELTSHQSRTMKEVELQVTGNLYFAFFVAPDTGKVRVRTIPADEIDDVITNPEDAKEPWLYKRVWQQRPGVFEAGTERREALYLDWHAPKTVYDQSAGPLNPASTEVTKLAVDAAGQPIRVCHVKVGALPDMRFGLPETYQALDWARAYKEFLEDFATIVRALSRFAWNMTVTGGARGVASAKSRIGTTLGAGPEYAESNPAPGVGSMFIRSEGKNLEPIKTANSTTATDEGKDLRLMVAAAFGLPDTFLSGDVSQGTLATARSLDRPTELKFRDRQTLWSDVWQAIFEFVVEQAARAPGGMLAGKGSVDEETGEFILNLGNDENGKPIEATVDVTFPPILEHDIAEQVTAIVAAATLDGKTLARTMAPKMLTRLLLQALSVDDIDEVLDVLYPDGEGEELPEEPEPEPVLLPGKGLPGSAARKPFEEAARDLAVRLKEAGYGV